MKQHREIAVEHSQNLLLKKLIIPVSKEVHADWSLLFYKGLFDNSDEIKLHAPACGGRAILHIQNPCLTLRPQL